MMWLEEEIYKRVFNYCQTSVLFFTYRGILSEYFSLQALHLSGTPSLKTGTRPPRYLHLHNRLYILIFEKLLSPSTHRFERKCKYKIYKTESSLPGLSMTMMKESCLSKQSRILTMCLHPYTFRNKHTSKGTGWPLIWKKIKLEQIHKWSHANMAIFWQPPHTHF